MTLSAESRSSLRSPSSASPRLQSNGEPLNNSDSSSPNAFAMGSCLVFWKSGKRCSTAPPNKTIPPVPLPMADSADAFVVRYQSNRPTYDDFRDSGAPIIEHIVQEKRFHEAGLDGATVRSALEPVPLVVKGLSAKDRETGKIKEGKDENPIVSILVPAALHDSDVHVDPRGATPAMQGIVEEKMQRIAEMMLGPCARSS